jgi:hypothetical protein
MKPPQPSGYTPGGRAPHVAGWQHVPSLKQICEALHGLHTIEPPQLSLTGRHDGFAIPTHVRGVQQVWVPVQTSIALGQLPHCACPPHPSSMTPHAPAPHMRGVHVGRQLLFTQ